LLADNEQALDGHFLRNTKGTWIDEFAAEFLRDRLRNPMEILPSEPTVSVEDLQKEIKKLENQRVELAFALADAERRAGANAEAAGLLKAAEGREKILENENKELIRVNAVLIGEKNTLEAVAEANGQEAARAKSDVEKITAELDALKEEHEKLEQMTTLQFRKMKRAQKAAAKKQAREDKKRRK
jgi:hypothetical protein